MALRRRLLGKMKKYNPVTPGTRGLVLVSRDALHSGKPVKKLVVGISETGGRNNAGRVTARHRGGRAKRLYRYIDFKRKKQGIFATVDRFEYDPNRTAFIALLKYDDGDISYILAPEGLKVGDRVVSSVDADLVTGNSLPLRKIPSGTIIHNVEMKLGKGAQLVRSAGCYATLVGLVDGYALVRLSSGETRLVRQECYATIGVVSNANHSNEKLAKAGRRRHKGWRPHVRGVAMNPVDHPHGGGEGKSSGGRHPVSPSAFPTKGKKTRNNKLTDRFIIKKRS